MRKYRRQRLVMEFLRLSRAGRLPKTGKLLTDVRHDAIALLLSYAPPLLLPTCSQTNSHGGWEIPIPIGLANHLTLIEPHLAHLTTYLVLSNYFFFPSFFSYFSRPSFSSCLENRRFAG